LEKKKDLLPLAGLKRINSAPVGALGEFIVCWLRNETAGESRHFIFRHIQTGFTK